MEIIGSTSVVSAIDVSEGVNDATLATSDITSQSWQDQLAFSSYIGDQNLAQPAGSISDEILTKLESINPAFSTELNEVQQAIGKVAETNNPVDYMQAFMQMSEFTLTANFTVAAASQFAKTIERVTNLQ